MKIEVLYLPGCPHHPAAVKRLREVLLTMGIAAEIHENAVTDVAMAVKRRFRGSPTIRINGRDIEGELDQPESFTLACRLYRGSQEAGVPPEQMIQQAIRRALSGGKP